VGSSPTEDTFIFDFQGEKQMLQPVTQAIVNHDVSEAIDLAYERASALSASKRGEILSAMGVAYSDSPWAVILSAIVYGKRAALPTNIYSLVGWFTVTSWQWLPCQEGETPFDMGEAEGINFFSPMAPPASFAGLPCAQELESAVSLLTTYFSRDELLSFYAPTREELARWLVTSSVIYGKYDKLAEMAVRVNPIVALPQICIRVTPHIGKMQ
jgi:hypothetical protein